jgi:hypothetical protein
MQDDDDDVDQEDDEKADTGRDGDSDDDDESQLSPKGILLPSGTSMQPDDSLRITCARSTRLIVIAGAADSGKTTLIASIYERFLQGPFARFNFAGSSTLRGFEQVCHPGRVASGLVAPATDRTLRSEGRKLLHLRVRPANDPTIDLLISDLSGEEFDDARESGEDARRLTVVSAAHRLVIMVDGGKLVQFESRQAAREESTTLLRTFVEEGLLPARTGVDIVFSKWDLVSGPTAARHEAFAQVIWQDFQGRFGNAIRDLRQYKVIARHPTG